MPIEEPRPAYRQVADLLRAAIEGGEYAPGQQLPSEDELAGRYGVARFTVNRAVQILRYEGAVRVERGIGTFVRPIPVIRRAQQRWGKAARELGGSRGAFDGEIRRLGMTPRSDVSVRTGTAPPVIAEVLGLPAGKLNVIIRRREMYANDVPVQLAPSYIPLEIARGTQLAEQDSGPGGIISRFAELGYPQERITESVRVRRPSDEERSFLRLEDDQPVIEIFHVGWTAGGRAVEAGPWVVPAHLWVLDYEWAI